MPAMSQTTTDSNGSQPSTHTLHTETYSDVPSQSPHLAFSTPKSPSHHTYKTHITIPHPQHPLSHPSITYTSRTHRKTRHHVTRDLLHNISFHVALFFVLGSIAWIVNGFYVMWPDQMVGDDSKAVDVMNWSAFCGGMLFLIGASLAVVEAGNADHPLPPPRNGGIDVEGGHEVMSMGDATQQQQQQQGKVNPTHNETTKPSDPPTTTRRYKLTWFPRPDPHSLGSLASLIQIFAATVFGISVITGLLTLSHTARMLIFWTPQVIGGLGFIVTSLVYMKEVGFTAVWTLGWQVAVWNLVGAVGFMLCGVFGYWEDAAGGWGWRETASGVNNFYGGWAFLLGSVLQMWEVLRKKPF